MMSQTKTAMTIDTRAITALQNRMHGELLLPGDAVYETARFVANPRFNRRPTLIARCRTSADVASAITAARQHGLEIAVRSGGHSTAGYSVGDDGMMIDLSLMRGIDIDPAQQIAHVQPGVLNGELVQALAAHGLAMTTGTCATVGLGGSTIGGGIGWLIGRFGMAIDHVLAFELVTAEGDVVNAHADERPDLFWALRGGGGNFGVVTSMTFRVHQLGPVLGGVAIFPLAAAAAPLRLYRDVSGSAPDELTAHAVLTTVPHIGPALIVQACYAGEDLAKGERILAPLLQAGPAVNAIAPRAYADLYQMLTPPMLPAARYYDTAYSVRQPSDEALDEVLACAAERPSPLSVINIHQVHGAASRVAANATAFALRDPHYAVANIGMWLDGDGATETAWAHGAQHRMEPFASQGVYSCFLGDEGDDAVRDAYQANYARLAAIKAQYDPDNIFHRNQNIHPAR